MDKKVPKWVIPVASVAVILVVSISAYLVYTNTHPSDNSNTPTNEQLDNSDTNTDTDDYTDSPEFNTGIDGAPEIGDVDIDLEDIEMTLSLVQGIGGNFFMLIFRHRLYEEEKIKFFGGVLYGV